MTKEKHSSEISHERRRTLDLIENLIIEVFQKDGVDEDILMDILLDKINNRKSLTQFEFITFLYLEISLEKSFTLNQ